MDHFKLTTHLINSYSAQNSNLSEMQRTQGNFCQINDSRMKTKGSTYLCWAYSCASMLRASCSILIQKLFEAGKIGEQKKTNCMYTIMNPECHTEIRNLIAMILLPKKLHKNDDSQAAYLRAAVSRVSYK